MFAATKDKAYEAAILKGLDHILNAQYPTGGWPQLDPPGPQYHRHITFNDNAMIRLMQFLDEVLTEDRPDIDVALEDWNAKEGLLAAIFIDFLRRTERRT